MRLTLDIKEAVRFFGSKTRIAKVLGISTSAVSQWGDGAVPAQVAAKIIVASKHHKYRRHGKLKYTAEMN